MNKIKLTENCFGTIYEWEDSVSFPRRIAIVGRKIMNQYSVITKVEFGDGTEALSGHSESFSEKWKAIQYAKKYLELPLDERKLEEIKQRVARFTDSGVMPVTVANSYRLF